MWGNWQGWVISAVMMLAAGGAFYRLANPSPESSPAGLLPRAYEPIALPMDAQIIFPAGARSADAGMYYRQAILHYRAQPTLYVDPIHAKLSDLLAIDPVLRAADCARMNLYEARPELLVNYSNDEPDLEALTKVADAVNTIGLGQRLDGHLDEAKKYFQATFALGRKLFEERVSWRELNAGLGLMADAARNLATVADEAHEGGRGDVLRKFQDETERYRAELQENVASPLTNPVESYAAKYAGDIFAIARDTRVERVWRVAAIMHLGRYRWNVADDQAGDQVWADRELALLEASIDPANSDPVILVAVKAARSLTVEQQRINAAPQ